ncbi:hypothetical protein FQA39_LY18466 [Lamprigera yunnana]|nr:hypothetical protein FQA39_LY18466 [Lamprigera yunnana]
MASTEKDNDCVPCLLRPMLILERLSGFNPTSINCPHRNRANRNAEFTISKGFWVYSILLLLIFTTTFVIYTVDVISKFNKTSAYVIIGIIESTLYLSAIVCVLLCLFNQRKKLIELNGLVTMFDQKTYFGMSTILNKKTTDTFLKKSYYLNISIAAIQISYAIAIYLNDLRGNYSINQVIKLILSVANNSVHGVFIFHSMLYTEFYKTLFRSCFQNFQNLMQNYVDDGNAGLGMEIRIKKFCFWHVSLVYNYRLQSVFLSPGFLIWWVLLVAILILNTYAVVLAYESNSEQNYVLIYRTILYTSRIVTYFAVTEGINLVTYILKVKEVLNNRIKKKNRNLKIQFPFSIRLQRLTYFYMSLVYNYCQLNHYINPVFVIWWTLVIMAMVFSTFTLVLSYGGVVTFDAFVTFKVYCTAISILIYLGMSEKINSVSDDLLSFLFKYPISKLSREDAAKSATMVSENCILCIATPLLTYSRLLGVPCYTGQCNHKERTGYFTIQSSKSLKCLALLVTSTLVLGIYVQGSLLANFMQHNTHEKLWVVVIINITNYLRGCSISITYMQNDEDIVDTLKAMDVVLKQWKLKTSEALLPIEIVKKLRLKTSIYNIVTLISVATFSLSAKSTHHSDKSSTLENAAKAFAEGQTATVEILNKILGLQTNSANTEQKKKELELKEFELKIRFVEARNKEKELALREKELALKEKEVALKEMYNINHHYFAILLDATDRMCNVTRYRRDWDPCSFAKGYVKRSHHEEGGHTNIRVEEYTCSVNIPSFTVALVEKNERWFIVLPKCDPFKEDLCLVTEAYNAETLALLCIRQVLIGGSTRQFASVCPISCRETGRQNQFISFVGSHRAWITHPKDGLTIKCQGEQYKLNIDPNLGALLIDVPCHCQFEDGNSTDVYPTFPCVDKAIKFGLQTVLPAIWTKTPGLRYHPG